MQNLYYEKNSNIYEERKTSWNKKEESKKIQIEWSKFTKSSVKITHLTMWYDWNIL